MDLVAFALWKSREIEQKVPGAHASELYRTRIDLMWDTYYVDYDISNDTAKIYKDGKADQIDGPFPIRDTPARLKNLKIFE